MTVVEMTSPIVIVSFLLLSVFSVSYGCEAWTKRPDPMFVPEGQTALLSFDYDCKIRNFHQIHLSKDKNYLLGMDMKKNLRRVDVDDRFTVIEDSMCIFQIKNITPSDQGNYIIELYEDNPSRCIKASFSLHVLISKEVSFRSTTGAKYLVNDMSDTMPDNSRMSSLVTPNFDESTTTSFNLVVGLVVGVVGLVVGLVLFILLGALVIKNKNYLKKCIGMQEGGKEMETIGDVENGNIPTFDPKGDEDDQ